MRRIILGAVSLTLAAGSGTTWAQTTLPSADTAAAPIALESISLEELLATPIRTGEAGSFGYSLEAMGIKPYLHGYATIDWAQRFQDGPDLNTFDAHYFNVFVGANIQDVVTPEIQIETEHGFEFAVRFAQVDVKVNDYLSVRAGLFLVPFGVYNEYLYPEYISKLPR